MQYFPYFLLLPTPLTGDIHDRGLGVRSGVLCLLKMLLLHEMNKMAAWVGHSGPRKSALPVHATHIAEKEFRTVCRNLKAYKLAIRAAWAVSPRQALGLAERFPALAEIDGTQGLKLSYLKL